MTFMAGASAAGLAGCHRARFSWLKADGEGCGSKGREAGRRPKVRLSGETGSGWPTLKTALLTQCMVRPCVARGFRRAIVSGLASMYPVSDWSCFAPDHHGYQRACDLIVGQTSMGQLGHQCSHAPGRPILHLFLSSRRPRRVTGIGSGITSSLFLSMCRRLGELSDGSGEFARFEGASMCKNAPGDPCQLLCQSNCEHGAVQLLCGGVNPGLEPVALPAIRLDQHHPCCLHEKDAQVAIAALRYLAEDRAIPGRNRPGHKP